MLRVTLVERGNGDLTADRLSKLMRVALKKAFVCNRVYIGRKFDEKYLVGTQLVSVYWCRIFNHFQNAISKALTIEVLQKTKRSLGQTKRK